MIQVFKEWIYFSVLAISNATSTKTHTEYKKLDAEIDDYNLMIHGRNCFDQLVKNKKRTNIKILKIKNGKGDNYATGCQLDYLYFKEIIR